MTDFIITAAISLYLLTAFFCAASIISDRNINYHLARAGFMLAAVSIIALGAVKIHPISQQTFFTLATSIWGYFYLLSLILTVIGGYLYFSRWNRQWKSFMALASLFVGIILLISLPFIDSTRRFTTETTSTLLPLHIFLSILGQLLFFFSFAGSVLYLIMERNLKKKRFMSISDRLPNLESIEKFNRWVTIRSFFLLTLGLAIGIIMQLISFKKIFLGTAKEVHIYFSWAVILGMSVLRSRSSMSSHRISLINIFFFFWVMFLFIFTNVFILKGFHSFQ
ncbi:MAG TPA: cytochrome c biogenesis protein CcsA [Spirochaetota bacterium]|nr:cytochrome c biogenesis protein CcsA [Spirochaetota bacterium]